ncbi:hypothetical protein C9I90_15490 [Photobacterium aphoticum]|nr:hypothetical protein C9I90_15490 [Photobacterium aphoticum]
MLAFTMDFEILTTAPQHHSTTAPQHHSTTAPQHHSTTGFFCFSSALATRKPATTPLPFLVPRKLGSSSLLFLDTRRPTSSLPSPAYCCMFEQSVPNAWKIAEKALTCWFRDV